MFYDELKKPELIEFCRTNGINYIPCRDRKTLYELIGYDFHSSIMDENFKINPYDRIFDAETIEKFGQSNHNEVRFITENDSIKGVVHISDYNNEFLQVELYRAIFRFESSLRSLLIKSGKKNEDFIEWVRMKHDHENSESSKKHWKKRLDEIYPETEEKRLIVAHKMKDLNPFQTFYLRELLRFASDNKIICKKKVNIDHVSELRNKIAHNVHLTSGTTSEEGTLIYNFDGLKEYIKLVRSFFLAYDYILEEVGR